MAYMSTPQKLQNAKFNFAPADPDIDCEACGADTEIYDVDSDFGPLSVALCLDCIDANYEPTLDI